MAGQCRGSRGLLALLAERGRERMKTSGPGVYGGKPGLSIVDKGGSHDTQREIAERLGVTQSVISEDIGNSEIGKIHQTLGPEWNDKQLAETLFPLVCTLRVFQG